MMRLVILSQSINRKKKERSQTCEKRARELEEGRVHLEEKKRRYAKKTSKYNTSYNPYHYCSYLFFMDKPYIFTSCHTMYC